jgi:hypothetical protein
VKTSEQLMISRQLNIRSKENMTVTRLRMLRENAARARLHGNKLGLVGEKDLIRLGKLIENDAISTEMYQQRLDEMLSLGAEVDEGAAGLSEAGRQVLDIWEKMDTGLIRKTEALTRPTAASGATVRPGRGIRRKGMTTCDPTSRETHASAACAGLAEYFGST